MHSAAFFAVVAAACFGVALVITQYGLRYMPAMNGALVSIPSTALVFWALSPLLLSTGQWQASAVVVFAGVGLFFPAVVTMLTFAANQRMGPTIAGTVGGTAPLFAIAGAVLFLGERLSVLVLLGTLAIVLGVMVLAWEKKPNPSSWPKRALLLPLTAAAIRGLAQLLTKYGLALWASPFAAGLVGYTASSATVFVAAELGRGRRPRALDRRGVMWFALAGLCNGAAVLSMYIALNRGRVTIVSPIVATYPLFTLLSSIIFLRREVVTPRVLVGVALTITGGIVILLR